MAMAQYDELVEQIGKLIDTKLEPLRSDIAILKHGQGQIKTVLKVLEAGQNDIRENMATKADIQDIKADMARGRRRIENLEDATKTPNPHKN